MARLEKLEFLVRREPAESQRETCLAALGSLRLTFATVVGPLARSARVWRWPVALDRRFLQLLGASKPLSLVIVAHYAALVRCCEGRQWFAQGWSAAVIKMACNCIGDDEDWKGWLEWPAACVRDGVDLCKESNCQCVAN